MNDYIFKCIVHGVVPGSQVYEAESGGFGHTGCWMKAERMGSKLLQEGDIIELNEHHKVYALVPKHFLYGNRRGDFTLAHGEVHLGSENFDYLRGRYIVTKTVMDGGGTGHGPHDVYPDGHHVYCESLDGSQRVDFYQSGCFTCMIVNIEPVGRAEKKWVVEEKVKFL
jgi:hypothetical protein